MARIRSIKPEFWDDRKLARSTSRDARMLYMGLWNQADEHGRCNGDEQWLKGRVFPFEEDIDIFAIKALLGELVESGRVHTYEVDGDPYLYLPKLAKHQRLEPAKVESKHPEPPPSEPRAHKSARRADESARESEQAETSANTGPSTSALIRADESAPDADSSALLYVAGSMEQGAGSVVVARDLDSAQTIIARWMEYVPQRPPQNIVGQVSKHVKALLDEGIAPGHVARGVRLWADKGLHPATLPSVVNEVMNARPAGTGRKSTTESRVHDALDISAQLAAEGR